MSVRTYWAPTKNETSQPICSRDGGPLYKIDQGSTDYTKKATTVACIFLERWVTDYGISCRHLSDIGPSTSQNALWQCATLSGCITSPVLSTNYKLKSRRNVSILIWYQDCFIMCLNIRRPVRYICCRLYMPRRCKYTGLSTCSLSAYSNAPKPSTVGSRTNHPCGRRRDSFTYVR